MKLLVTGLKRSGTTFLSNLLNSQDDITVISDFIRSPFIEAKKLKIYDLNSPLSERQQNVLRSNLIAEFNLMGWDGSRLNKLKFDSVLDLFSKSLDVANEESDSIAGVKITNLQPSYIQQLCERNIRAIHIYRDPRDVALSSKNRFSNFHLFNFARSYKSEMNELLEIKHDNFISLSFEKLIAKDSHTISRMESFIGKTIELDAEHLKMRKGNRYVENSSFGDIDKLFDKKSVYRWKEAGDSDVHHINKILKKEIIKLGYEPYDSGSTSIPLLFKFWLYSSKHVVIDQLRFLLK